MMSTTIGEIRSRFTSSNKLDCNHTKRQIDYPFIHGKNRGNELPGKQQPCLVPLSNHECIEEEMKCKLISQLNNYDEMQK